MAKIQVRNFPDDFYARIAQAAADSERSIEGEVRHTLMKAYPERLESSLSLRERWQHETAGRLQQLIARLEEDDFWPRRSRGGVVPLARMMKEATPAYLMDCLDGTASLSYDAAQRLAGATSCSARWLLDGYGDMFPVEDIGSRYHEFFQPAAPGDYRFHIFRLGKAPGIKPLFCIRHNRADDTYAMGQVMGQFYLGDGMGATGMGNLKRFLQYLKKHSAGLRWTSYIFDGEENPDTGEHHPCFYLNGVRHSESSWLETMLNGGTPGWLSEFSYYAEEVKKTPYGDRQPAGAAITSDAENSPAEQMAQRFLSFMTARGFSCNRPEDFAGFVAGNACGPHESVVRTMTLAIGIGITFVQDSAQASPETSPETVQAGLRDVLGFSDADAAKIAATIQFSGR